MAPSSSLNPLWIGALAVGLSLLFNATSRLFRAFIHQRRIRGGYVAESQAERTLEHQGYLILERQPKTRWRVRVDGKATTVELRADLRVARAGEEFLVEVKSGDKDLSEAALRRQLLEYAVVFGRERLLLVDKRGQRVREVELPWRRSRRLNCIYWTALGVFGTLAYLNQERWLDAASRLAPW